MAKLPTDYEFGDPENIDISELVVKLKKMYGDLAGAINKKPDVYFRQVGGVPSDGATTDTFLSNGDININTSTNKIEMLVEHTDPQTVVWKEI